MEQNKAERLNENVTEKMCSSDGNVVGEMCSPADTDTCGSRHMSKKDEFVEILCFRHFARYMSFAPTGKMGNGHHLNSVSLPEPRI